MAILALTICFSVIPYGKYLSNYFLGFYFLLVQAHILGLFYHRNREKLKWY